jgi:hypothetical protein
VQLLDGLAAILINNPKEAYKVGQFLLYLRKLMEENENILLIPIHEDLLRQTLFEEILPLLKGQPNFHFINSGKLEFDPEKITLVDNTLVESRLDIKRDNTTDMWHQLKGKVRLGRMPRKSFSILSDRKPIEDLNVRVLDGSTGEPLNFDAEEVSEDTITLDIMFPEPLEPREEYHLIIEYRTTTFRSTGEDYFVHSVVSPIGEKKTVIRFPEGISVESLEKSYYQVAGDLKRPMHKYPSKDHILSISDDRREITHMLTASPERCNFCIVWNTVDRG